MLSNRRFLAYSEDINYDSNDNYNSNNNYHHDDTNDDNNNNDNGNDNDNTVEKLPKHTKPNIQKINPSKDVDITVILAVTIILIERQRSWSGQPRSHMWHRLLP